MKKTDTNVDLSAPHSSETPPSTPVKDENAVESPTNPYGKAGQVLRTLFDSSMGAPLKITSRLASPIPSLMYKAGFTPGRLLELAASSDARLHRLDLDISYFGQAKVIHTAWKSDEDGGKLGEPVPRITIKRGAGGWYLLEVCEIGNWGFSHPETALFLTPRQHAYLIWRLSSSYRVYRPQTGERVQTGIKHFDPFIRY